MDVPRYSAKDAQAFLGDNGIEDVSDTHRYSAKPLSFVRPFSSAARVVLVPTDTALSFHQPTFRNTHVYAGIGIAGRALSVGLPVDVLALVATVEHVRRTSTSRRAALLVADNNAIAAGFCSDRVRGLARSYVRSLQRVCDFLGFDIDIHLASQWNVLHSKDVRPLGRPDVASLPAYVRMQLEQMNALAHAGFRIKVGWRMTSARRDETHFDSLYRNAIASGMNRRIGSVDGIDSHRPTPELHSLYTLPGRSFDDARPRTCPYITYLGHQRILFGQSEGIRAHLGRELVETPKAARGYRRHLIKIARSLRPLLPTALQEIPALDLFELLNRISMKSASPRRTRTERSRPRPGAEVEL